MLETLAVLCLLVALAGLAGIALVGVPFVLATELADRRGFSTFRWGLASLAGGAVMLALGYAVLTGHHSKLLLLLALALGWLGVTSVSLIEPSRQRLGGRQGVHQR